MTKHIFPPRPAGAAIAAVLALSSTAAFAQEIVAPPSMPAAVPAPVLIIPQAAPAPAAPAPVIVMPAQPTAPVVAEAAAPAPRATRQVAQRPSVSARPAVRAAAPAPVARTAEPAVTAAPVAAVAAVQTADIEFAPTQTALPADATPELDTATTVQTDGGLGAGELGLIGGALAVGGIAAAALFARRRRRDPAPEPVDVFAARSAAPPTPLAPQPMAVPMTTARAAPVAPIAVGTGNHVRQAEQGPTADNPFLTRRNRLRRARFLDAQEAKLNPVDRVAAQSQAAPAKSDWLDDYRQQNRAASGLSGDWMDDNNPRLAPAGAH